MRILFTILVMIWAAFAQAQSSGLTVIAHPKGAPPELKLPELKSILMGERQRWRNGNKIIIALMKTNTAVGKQMSERLFNMNGDEVKKYWLALVFQGKADAPNFFNSASELQAFVAETPGAIGVVDQPQPGAGTGIITVDGKRTF